MLVSETHQHMLIIWKSCEQFAHNLSDFKHSATCVTKLVMSDKFMVQSSVLLQKWGILFTSHDKPGLLKKYDKSRNRLWKLKRHAWAPCQIANDCVSVGRKKWNAVTVIYCCSPPNQLNLILVLGPIDLAWRHTCMFYCPAFTNDWIQFCYKLWDQKHV